MVRYKYGHNLCLTPHTSGVTCQKHYNGEERTWRHNILCYACDFGLSKDATLSSCTLKKKNSKSFSEGFQFRHLFYSRDGDAVGPPQLSN